MATTEATDRIELRELSDRYAQAVDRRDYESLGTLFTEDGRIAGFAGDPSEGDPLYEMVGHAGIRAGMKQLERYDKFHFVGNQLVDVAGDSATGETYCVAHHLYQQDGVLMDYTLFIRYQDRYRRAAHGSRIAERLLVLDFGRRAPVRDDPAD